MNSAREQRALVEKVDQLGKADTDFTTGTSRKFTGTLRLDSFRRLAAANANASKVSPTPEDGGTQ